MDTFNMLKACIETQCKDLLTEREYDERFIEKLCKHAWNALQFVENPRDLSQAQIEVFTRAFTQTFSLGMANQLHSLCRK